MGQPVNPRAGLLWTSAEAARAFRVGVSSIKRWTNEGELESVRTPGGHRRYTLTALYRFASIRSLSFDHLPPLQDEHAARSLPLPADITLLGALVEGNEEGVRRLVHPGVDDLDKRAAFLDRVIGDALREIGNRWDDGTLGVDDEHRASHMLADAVDRLRPQIQRGTAQALLACPPSELHDLPLRLVRLILEWRGWRTDFIGAQTPWQALRNAVERARPRLVLLSARASEPFLASEFGRLVSFCSEHGTIVAVGGEWARGGRGNSGDYLRFRTLRGFDRWLRVLDPARGQSLPVTSSTGEDSGRSGRGMAT